MISRPIENEDPVISVVIPTIPKNDHGTVVDILKNQSIDHPYEVIVVNDGGLDICEARNEGIEVSNSEIVCLTDDDCKPPRNWLSSIHYIFEGQDLVCAEGPVAGGINYSGKRKYVGCNLAFNRSSALEIGGFNSTFAGWRDDTEFGWRIEEVGNCTYDSRMLMNHPPRPGSGYIIENEHKLKQYHPKKYNEVMIENATLKDRLYRKALKYRVADIANLFRYDR